MTTSQLPVHRGAVAVLDDVSREGPQGLRQPRAARLPGEARRLARRAQAAHQNGGKRLRCSRPRWWWHGTTRERASRRPAGDGVRRDPCRLYADVPAELGVAAFARVVRRDGVRGGVVLRCAVSGDGRGRRVTCRSRRRAAHAAVVGCGRNDRPRSALPLPRRLRFAAQERDQRIEQPVPCRRVAGSTKRHDAARSRPGLSGTRRRCAARPISGARPSAMPAPPTAAPMTWLKLL